MSLDEMQGVYVIGCSYGLFFFFSSRRRHTIYWRDCSSDVCSSDLGTSRPTVIIRDATFDVVSVLEEHRNQFPGLIIQSAPKRYYPDGPAVSAFIGYTAEINERELASPQYASYKMGQQIRSEERRVGKECRSRW